MEMSDVRIHLKNWLRNLKDAQAIQKKEGNNKAVSYYQGGIEAYQRVLDTIGSGIQVATPREAVLETIALHPESVLPFGGRWEHNGITFFDRGLSYYIGWWEITDYVINRRLDEPIKRIDVALGSLEKAFEDHAGDMLKNKP